MVDTLKLFTPDFKINSNAPGWHHVSDEDNATGELYSEKLWRNTPNGSDLKVYNNSKLFYTVHSLPGVLYGSSLQEVRESDLEKALSVMGGDLHAAGVDFDEGALQLWRVSRIDYCANIQTDKHASEYILPLQMGVMPFMRSDHVPGETALWLNANRQFTCYNKIKAIRDKGQSISAKIEMGTPENIVRIESRFTKARTVRERTKVRTLGECWSAPLARRLLLEDFDEVALLSDKLQTIAADLSRLFELSHESRYFITRWEQEIARDAIMSKYDNSIELIKKLLLPLYPNSKKRSQLYVYLRKLKRYMAERMEPEKRNLLLELREKLAA